MEVFEAPDGDLYLLGPDEDHVIEAATDQQVAMLRALQAGPVSIARLAELVRTEPSAIRDEVDELEEAGLVVTVDSTAASRPLAGADAVRYARQLPYFAAARPGHEHTIQRGLASASVAILGVGGLGSWTAASLACLGIGHMTLIDDDTVELHNLNRQLLYTPSDIGHPKVDVASRALRAFNPRLSVTTVAQRVRSVRDVAIAIDGASFVVVTADWPPYLLSRWVNEACLSNGTPYTSAGQVPPLIRVGPTVVPGKTACFECIERASRRQFAHYDALVAQRSAKPTVATTLGPASGIVGSMVATDVCHHLTGVALPGTFSRGVTVDLRTWDVHARTYERDAECPLCGPDTSQPTQLSGLSVS